MIEEFAKLIPPELGDMSGKAFHAGRLAFSGRRDLYVLGLNPGGDPEIHQEETVTSNAEQVLRREAHNWSAFLDESWAPGGKFRPPGQAPMQVEMQQLLRCVGLDPREVPASDVCFVRSPQAKDIKNVDKEKFLELCWPFHRAVIRRLGIRVVLCLYKEAATFIQKKTGAWRQVDEIACQSKKRKYLRKCFAAPSGLKVVQITRPTGIPWTEHACALTKRALAG